MGVYKVDRRRDIAGPTELKIHGVGGEPADSMLNEDAYLVAGDEVSGFYKVAKHVADADKRKKSIEAYSWGGLTSGGGFFQRLRESLWIILLPYALVNASGWMVAERGALDEDASRLHKVIHAVVDGRERIIRVLGAWLTIAFGMWLAAITVDLAALQCANITDCAEGHSWLSWVDGTPIQMRPGRLMVLAMAVPVFGLLVAWQASYRSQKKSEVVGEEIRNAELDKGQTYKTNAGAGTGGKIALQREALWGSPKRVAAMTRLHLAAALLFVAAALAWSASWMEGETGDSRVLLVSLAIVCVAMGLGAALWMVLGGRRPTRRTRFVLTAAFVLLPMVAVVTWFSSPTWTEVSTGIMSTQTGRDPAMSIANQFNGAFLLLGIAPIVLLLAALLVTVWLAPFGHDHYTDDTRRSRTPAWLARISAPFAHKNCGNDALKGRVRKWHSRWGPWGAATLGVVTGAPILAGGALWIGSWIDRSNEDDLCHLCIDDYDILIPDFYTAAAVALLLVIAMLFVGTAFFLVKRRAARKAQSSSRPMRAPFSLLQKLTFANKLGTVSPAERLEATDNELWADMVASRALDGCRHDFPVHASKTDEELRTEWKKHEGYEKWLQGIVGTRLTVRYLIQQMTLTALVALALAVVLGGWGVIEMVKLFLTSADANWVDALTSVDQAGTVAKWALVIIFGALLRIIYQAYREADTRRDVARLWDVLNFFPRWYHPFAPPSYAAVALPQLTTHLGSRHQKPESTIVLAAHSQGTVIAVATVARIDSKTRERIALLTFGSPVRTLYGWLFPRFYGFESMVEVRRLLNDKDGNPRWRNLRRCTDPIGGTIFTPLGREECADLSTSVTPHPDGSRRVNDVDWIVPDPFPIWPADGDPMPPMKGHSNYDVDPPYESALKELFTQLGVPLEQVGLLDPGVASAEVEGVGDVEEDRHDADQEE